MGLISFLYRLARAGTDMKAVTSGKPRKIAKRGRNKILGRIVGKRLFK